MPVENEETVENEDQEFEDAFAEAAGKKAENVEEESHEDDIPDPPKDKDDEPGDEEITDPPKEEDPYAGLPEAAVERIKALEAENADLEHKVNSNNGRVAAYQRQVNELQQAIDQGQRRADQDGGSGGDKPSMEQVADAMQDEDSWDSFKEEYPEIADAIDKRMESRLGSVEEKIAPVFQDMAEKEIEKGYSYLDEHHEGWRDRVASPVFQEWITTQPDVVQQWADSDDPNEASSLIQFYDNYLMATGKMSEFENADGGSPPGDQDSGNQTDALKQRRKQQLEDGEAIHSRGAGVSTDGGPADEFDAAFDMYAKRAERQRNSA